MLNRFRFTRNTSPLLLIYLTLIGSLASATAQDPDDSTTVKGRVFIDRDEDGRFSTGDSPFPDVRVSNGVTIVRTDASGNYELPLENEAIVFVIKPTGYRTALNKLNLPMFFYIHKPDGSPNLRFAGSKPTGPIPRSVDFPLYPQTETDQFQVLLFGDPQPRNQTEVNYIARDVIPELLGTPSKFGVTLGDIVFDDLAIFEPLNETVGLIGIPWYNVIGNHDLNLDAPNRKYVNETFERIYGPTYYSFDYGQVHFIVLDTIDWLPPAGDQRGKYEGRLGDAQLKWVQQDLKEIPDSQMVVLLMHIPIRKLKDCQDLYRMIEQRSKCISISGHVHQHEHIMLGQKDGWKGKNPHHHVINVTVSGSWWSGQKDIRGIPHATMSDGAPNGYSVLSFDERGYQINFKAAGSDEQMGIRIDDIIPLNKAADYEVAVNVYNGSDKTKVRMSVDSISDWLPMEKRKEVDPWLKKLSEAEKGITPAIEPQLSTPSPSPHLWFGKLPGNLEQGLYLLKVEATDMHGQVFASRQTFRITDE